MQDAVENSEQFMKRMAFWILKKEKHRLTQSTLDEVLLDVTDLLKDLMGSLGRKIAKV